MYDPRSITAEITRLKRGGAPTPITHVGLPPGLEHTKQLQNYNESFVTGYSALPCYEPVFGYLLEMVPARALQSGAILSGAGLQNMADPRCCLASSTSRCAPGTPFGH